jgi:hypothetical protein
MQLGDSRYICPKTTRPLGEMAKKALHPIPSTNLRLRLPSQQSLDWHLSQTLPFLHNLATGVRYDLADPIDPK